MHRGTNQCDTIDYEQASEPPENNNPPMNCTLNSGRRRRSGGSGQNFLLENHGYIEAVRNAVSMNYPYQRVDKNGTPSVLVNTGMSSGVVAKNTLDA